ncbi:response regulator [Mucilaginibacter sp. 10I4]|uniref:response regulator n=1 Tax=Mucilaginibacter sp. 10I4 TaxID=3048580 RepID=UPI002B235F12|nr:response regulator [Mucilaginibacter sp. 10I4]MEB0264043.1 response regulator [Mucilaginibacter sp. 10I4]
MNRILIIEDNEINCMIYRKILTSDFTDLHFAYDGEQGIDKFKENSYLLVLLDLGLPKIVGLEVAHLIKEFEINEQRIVKTPIIVITADNSQSTKLKALAAGVNEYITKPFNIEDLKTIVGYYIQGQIKKIEI